jgi:hypothetical protein
MKKDFNLGLYSGAIELDTSKLKDQLKAIEMAAGALAHNLNEIDALYEEGEKETYTKTMAKPEAFEPSIKDIERDDIVLVTRGEYKSQLARVLDIQDTEVKLHIQSNSFFCKPIDIILVAKGLK